VQRFEPRRLLPFAIDLCSPRRTERVTSIWPFAWRLGVVILWSAPMHDTPCAHTARAQQRREGCTHHPSRIRFNPYQHSDIAVPDATEIVSCIHEKIELDQPSAAPSRPLMSLRPEPAIGPGQRVGPRHARPAARRCAALCVALVPCRARRCPRSSVRFPRAAHQRTLTARA
jgi:hypothetical protein